MTFKERVLRTVRRIRKGRVMTYGEVAAAAGRPRASRAVGSFMRGNHDASVPCHRVVRADLRAGEYNRGGESAKVARLKREGVRFRGLRVRRHVRPVRAGRAAAKSGS